MMANKCDPWREQDPWLAMLQCILLNVAGSSHVNESMLTGESSPVAKAEGCPVLGGTLNTTGTLLVRVLRVGQDTTLSQIVALVERAQLSKAPVQKFADTVSYLAPSGCARS